MSFPARDAARRWAFNYGDAARAYPREGARRREESFGEYKRRVLAGRTKCNHDAVKCVTKRPATGTQYQYESPDAILRVGLDKG